ncbi:MULTISPECIES: hypothetical protein [Paraburkholderia]|jgi:hypothetical protein|uniref:YfdQ family protein n=1 Tax=Paraburkholderia madseniana TaxID=2599607 RepID=A0AAP5ERB1_9BURK|nr:MULTISPECIES: hypothetical protein [Paraburkholderia]MCX4150091.1 hypothetical protein [Paraburkholderia madseniana]MDN7153026.1 YfdQ family protein [Paraburkholderia sp. WS6]MDQ6411908.1 YfdQ family protein [Paraburkholderia madseniana]
MFNEFHGEKDASAILTAGIALAGPHKSPLNDGVPFVVVPEGFKVEHLFERDDNLFDFFVHVRLACDFGGILA